MISWLTVFSLWTNIQPWAIIKYYSRSLSLLTLYLASLSQFCSALRSLLSPSLSPSLFSAPLSPLSFPGVCRGRLSPLFPVKQIKMAAVWMGLLSVTTFTFKNHSHKHTSYKPLTVLASHQKLVTRFFWFQHFDLVWRSWRDKNEWLTDWALSWHVYNWPHIMRVSLTTGRNTEPNKGLKSVPEHTDFQFKILWYNMWLWRWVSLLWLPPHL